MSATRQKSVPGPAAAASLDEICSVRIELLDTDPLIWREVEVPTSIMLKVLHDIVQITIGWLDYHLWESTIAGKRCRPPMKGGWDDSPSLDPAKTRLRDVLKNLGTTLQYSYDFGDSWEHRLIITNVRQGHPGVSYPRYVGGERSGPPEDCGGIPGFYALLDALEDPAHPDHAEVKANLDGWDPEEIEELPLKIALGRIANRRNAARKRITSPGA